MNKPIKLTIEYEEYKNISVKEWEKQKKMLKKYNPIGIPTIHSFLTYLENNKEIKETEINGKK